MSLMLGNSERFSPYGTLGPYYLSGTYPHRFSAGNAKILGRAGIPTQLVSVLVDQKDSATTLRLYDGTNRSGSLIAAISCAKLGTYPLNFRLSKGLFVSCDGGAGSAVVIVEAATYNNGTLTMSGNEITDTTRTAAIKWGTAQSGGSVDEFNPPDSSYGIWEAGTNLFRRGQCDATTDWGVNTGTGVTLATDATTPAPFSPQSIKYTVDGTQSAQGTLATTATGQAAAAGTIGVASAWLKGASGQTFNVVLQWKNTDSSTTLGSTSSIVATGNWQLVTAPSVAVASGKTGDSLRLIVASTAMVPGSFNVAHGMIQTGVAVVSPYIATTGGNTATRSTARVQIPANCVTNAQGWIAMRVNLPWAVASPPHPGSAPFFFSWADSLTNRIIGYFDAGGTNSFKIQRNTASGSDTDSGPTETFVAGTSKTLIFMWDSGHVYLSVDGAAFTHSNGTKVPTMVDTQIDIGTGGVVGTGREIDANVLWVACGVGVLADADAATINGFGSTDKLVSDFPGNCTFFWPADTSRYYTS